MRLNRLDLNNDSTTITTTNTVTLSLIPIILICGRRCIFGLEELKDALMAKVAEAEDFEVEEESNDDPKADIEVAQDSGKCSHGGSDVDDSRPVPPWRILGCSIRVVRRAKAWASTAMLAVGSSGTARWGSLK